MTTDFTLLMTGEPDEVANTLHRGRLEEFELRAVLINLLRRVAVLAQEQDELRAQLIKRGRS
jgi:hypothetical protein